MLVYEGIRQVVACLFSQQLLIEHCIPRTRQEIGYVVVN